MRGFIRRAIWSASVLVLFLLDGASGANLEQSRRHRPMVPRDPSDAARTRALQRECGSDVARLCGQVKEDRANRISRGEAYFKCVRENVANMTSAACRVKVESLIQAHGSAGGNVE